jgi:hypothetical protein
MGRDDVPADHVLLELGEDALDDRGGRFGRAGAGEQPLGGEGEAADTGPAIAGRLADEQDPGMPLGFEVGV